MRVFSWKFESSSGHHKKPPFMGVFFGAIKQDFSNFHEVEFDYKRQADFEDAGGVASRAEPLSDKRKVASSRSTF